MKWPGLEARLRGRRLIGLRYELDEGYAIAQALDDGDELWVSAGREEGCHLFTVNPARAPEARERNPRRNAQRPRLI